MTYEHEQVKELTLEFDNDEKFVLGVIDFLEEIGWLKEGTNSGEYTITEKGNNQM